MRRWILYVAPLLLAGLCASVGDAVPAKASIPAVRGRDIVLHDPLNPPIWSATAYDNAWKQWGIAKKPADYGRAFRQRYGLHANPFDKRDIPLGLAEARGLFGKGLVNTCLLCHAGRVAGQTYIGLGNASLELQGLFEDLSGADRLPFRLPFHFSHVRGTIDPVSPVAYLMQFRNADLSLQKPARLDLFPDLCSDPPAWWLLKKKRTRDWTGGIDARSTRIDLANLLNPFNSGAYIKQHAATFADIHAFLLTVEAPRYPFPVDAKLAGRGRGLFGRNCARCHGTYGKDWTYPNKVVPLDKIGTDPLLAKAVTGRNLEYFNKSWFAHEPGSGGKPYRVRDTAGYQAPPLDGIWATAPYFHNASAPTVYHVLNSKARPSVFTRSYRTERENYDPAKLGWKITVLDRPPDSKLPAIERRKVYDTTLPGRGNGGHPFGDKLTEPERLAVIEYLKTL
ncbi:MAG TPA: hypothetical protein VG013_25045 [Gemmataceae bacterium]|jgi:mono/diheme cytochrome c family protein|nr:hypothetical protein [Gemmataceae bacterium]